MRRVYICLLCISSASAQVPEQTIDEQPLVLVDTSELGDPQGNWLFKRHWWKRANRIYDHLTTLVNEIFELRSRFMNERSMLERDLFDPFYLRIGIKQGELQALISYLIEQLEKDTQTQEIPDAQQLLLGKLNDHKDVIMQLNDEIKEVGMIDQEIDSAITTLIEQLNLVRSYKQQAWDAFKAIERELSDQRARELVFEMHAFQKNINDIKTYLLSSFTEFFDTLVERAGQEVSRLGELIGELKDKGIDLKKEAQVLEFTEKELSESGTQPSQGFFSWLWSRIMSLFS